MGGQRRRARLAHQPPAGAHQHHTTSPRHVAASPQDLGAATSDQTRKQGEGGRQLRSQSKAGSVGRGTPGERRAAAQLVQADSLDSQKEMDALQGLCDLRGTA